MKHKSMEKRKEFIEMAEDWHVGYNKYMREYRKKNPEKIKEIQRRCYLKKKAKIEAQAANTVPDGEKEKHDGK